MPSLVPGLRLHERYALVERIGAGGMSEVWRANDEVLARPVAVKVLAGQVAVDPVLQEATWREARAAARLTHPHVTQVYDYGEAGLPDGASLPYLVMELVDGESLAARLTHGPLPWPHAVRVGEQVAAALAAAHRLGLVHRDIKPGNVMLTPTGAKVLDFGIAALAGGRSEADRQLLVGTPTYAAPERFDPAPAEPASDLYSLGVVLYEMLTGHPPARLPTWADAVAARQAARETSAAPPALEVPELPAEVARLCLACLSPDPAERPTAEVVAAALAKAAGAPRSFPTPRPVAGSPTLAAAGGYAVGSAPLPRAPTTVDRLRSVTGRRPARTRGGNRLMVAGVGVAVVVIGLVLVLAAAALRPDEPGGTADPGGGAAGPGAGAATSAASTPATPQVQPAPAAPDEILTQLDRAITDALGDRRIERDGAAKLRDKLDDLAKELDRDDDDKRAEKLRDKAEDLLEETEDLREDNEIDQATVDQLVTLLGPLTSVDDDDDDDD